MPLFSMPDLRAQLRRGQRLIGLDPGAKLIGVALSDVGLMLASPYGSIRRGKLAANAAELTTLARREGAGGLVSSAAVNRFLIDQADLSRGKRAARVDAMAAAYTLQSALDASSRSS